MYCRVVKYRHIVIPFVTASETGHALREKDQIRGTRPGGSETSSDGPPVRYGAPSGPLFSSVETDPKPNARPKSPDPELPDLSPISANPDPNQDSDSRMDRLVRAILTTALLRKKTH